MQIMTVGIGKKGSTLAEKATVKGLKAFFLDPESGKFDEKGLRESLKGNDGVIIVGETKEKSADLFVTKTRNMAKEMGISPFCVPDGHVGIGDGSGPDKVEMAVKRAFESMEHETDLFADDRLLISICGDISLYDLSRAHDLITKRTGGDSRNDILDAVYDDSKPEYCMVLIANIGGEGNEE